MRSNQTTILICGLLLAVSAGGCSIMGGSNSNTANNSTSTQAANAPAATKNEDLPILAAPKLVEMLMADTAGLNERLKDKEIIVIGEFSNAMNGVQLNGGPLRDIYCTLAPGGDPAKYQKLQNLSYGEKKPIVEVRGVFTKGTFETNKGLRYVSIFLDKCTIVSIQ